MHYRSTSSKLSRKSPLLHHEAILAVSHHICISTFVVNTVVFSSSLQLLCDETWWTHSQLGCLANIDADFVINTHCRLTSTFLISGLSASQRWKPVMMFGSSGCRLWAHLGSRYSRRLILHQQQMVVIKDTAFRLIRVAFLNASKHRRAPHITEDRVSTVRCCLLLLLLLLRWLLVILLIGC